MALLICWYYTVGMHICFLVACGVTYFLWASSLRGNWGKPSWASATFQGNCNSCNKTSTFVLNFFQGCHWGRVADLFGCASIPSSPRNIIIRQGRIFIIVWYFGDSRCHLSNSPFGTATWTPQWSILYLVWINLTSWRNILCACVSRWV